VHHNELTLATLAELRAMGVRIAMDDFGKGYSSLAYLHRFAFDKIKIDRAFVSELATSVSALAILRAIATLGHSLGIATTAEGIETEAQLDIVRALGCTEMQCNHFSAPRPASELSARPQSTRLSDVGDDARRGRVCRFRSPTWRGPVRWAARPPARDRRHPQDPRIDRSAAPREKPLAQGHRAGAPPG
jgi:predicted signal transduction protein with EAL and GGDEF domain